MKLNRDMTIDIARSVAIILMVAANMAILADDEPLWIFRFCSSMAAPMFVIIANMMVVLGFHRNKGVVSAIIKCLFLFVVAGLFDLSNMVLPLVNNDILYMLGLSLVFTSIVGRFNKLVIAGIIVGILLITPCLQFKYGYHQNMIVDITDGNVRAFFRDYFTEVPHRYLMDGWFPLFPWVSLGLFGALLAKYRYYRQRVHQFCKINYVLPALALIAIGGLLWWCYPGNQIIRYGYIELFYEPVPGFMILVMGLVLGLICVLDYFKNFSYLHWMLILGEAPLFMYCFHIAVIDHVLYPLGQITFGFRYFIYYVLLLATMMLIGMLLEKVRQSLLYKRMPHLIRWLFG